jgi:D-lactate dehydrogenase
MKIAFFEVEDWERPALQPLAAGHDLRLTADALRPANAGDYADSAVVSTFIYSDLSGAVLGSLPNLKFIATRSTGYDHIDMEYCRKRGIAVANVPVYGTNTVAEHVFALLLTASRRLVEAIDRTRRGDFTMQGLRGFDLRGKTIGVIGTGSIGQCVIAIAKGFGMEVLAHDVRRDEGVARRLAFSYVSMEELLERSDVVTLHVPATPETENLLSTDEFARMKDGVVLINTARGSLIDTEALLHALADGKVGAAGLDVLPEEPTIREEAELLRSVFRKEHNLETLFADHLLMHMRNVYVTPHIAFDTKEAVARIMRTTIDNVRAYVAGKPTNIVGGVP